MAKTIKSTGPIPCDVAVVAERPGREEQSRGYVLCGPSGQELNRYLLNESGIDRSNAHCCNLVRDYREGDNPEMWEVDRDWPVLVDELLAVRPRYVMALGLWSTRAFLGHDMELDWSNGLHFPLHWNAFDFTVMPVIHTAAGLHRPADAGKIAYGFRQFGKLIRGERLPTGHLSTTTTTNYSNDPINLDCVVAMDTEGTVDRPWGLSYSCHPGTASVQKGRRHRNWDCKHLDEALVVLHNSLHDLPVLARLSVRPRQFTDSMLMASLLGVEPLGLKALARRWCGMKMTEYDDVVRDARREKALDYLGEVLDSIKEVVNET